MLCNRFAPFILQERKKERENICHVYHIYTVEQFLPWSTKYFYPDGRGMFNDDAIPKGHDFTKWFDQYKNDDMHHTLWTPQSADR